MAEDMYLKIGDIAGEAHGDLTGQIKIQSWRFGATQSATMHDSTGGGSAAAKVDDLEIVKFIDSASPNIFACCAAGTHIADALLTVRKAGGGQVEYLKIHMENVIISSYEVGQETASNEKIKEKFKINCARIKIEYLPQEDEGVGGGSIEGGWDMRNVKPWPE